MKSIFKIIVAALLVSILILIGHWSGRNYQQDTTPDPRDAKLDSLVNHANLLEGSRDSLQQVIKDSAQHHQRVREQYELNKTFERVRTVFVTNTGPIDTTQPTFEIDSTAADMCNQWKFERDSLQTTAQLLTVDLFMANDESDAWKATAGIATDQRNECRDDVKQLKKVNKRRRWVDRAAGFVFGWFANSIKK